MSNKKAKSRELRAQASAQLKTAYEAGDTSFFILGSEELSTRLNIKVKVATALREKTTENLQVEFKHIHDSVITMLSDRVKAECENTPHTRECKAAKRTAYTLETIEVYLGSTGKFVPDFNVNATIGAKTVEKKVSTSELAIKWYLAQLHHWLYTIGDKQIHPDHVAIQDSYLNDDMRLAIGAVSMRFLRDMSKPIKASPKPPMFSKGDPEPLVLKDLTNCLLAQDKLNVIKELTGSDDCRELNNFGSIVLDLGRKVDICNKSTPLYQSVADCAGEDFLQTHICGETSEAKATHECFIG